MLLVGLILFLFLLGDIGFVNIIPLFLIGIGVILTTVGFAKFKEKKSQYAIPPKVYLGYGVLLIMVGGLWLAVSIRFIVAEFLLATVLVLAGLAFLWFSVAKR